VKNIVSQQKKSKRKIDDIIMKQLDLIAEIKKIPCWSCEEVTYILTQIEASEGLKKQMEDIHKILEGNVDEKEQDFNNRNTIL
jgi:hypothetical protein